MDLPVRGSIASPAGQRRPESSSLLQGYDERGDRGLVKRRVSCRSVPGADPASGHRAGANKSREQALYRLDDANRLLGLVVAGPTAGTVWASKDRGGLIQVVLEDPARVVVTAPGAVYHLARAGTRVAALLVDQAGGRVTAASVVVLDAAARGLWRAPVSTSSTGELEPHWVAGSDAYITVGTMSELRVFDAVTGQQLTT